MHMNPFVCIDNKGYLWLMAWTFLDKRWFIFKDNDKNGTSSTGMYLTSDLEHQVKKEIKSIGFKVLGRLY